MFNKFLTTSENEFEKLCRREIELTERKATAISALGKAETAAGLALIESDATGELGDALRVRADVDATNTALRSIRSSRAAVIERQNKADAEKIRESVSAQRRELASLESKTTRLLAQISELQETPYSASHLERMPLGDGVRGWHETRSMRLRAQIDDAEKRAASIETSGVRASGFFDSGDSAVISDREILEGVLASRTDGPTAEVVQGWLNSLWRGNPDHAVRKYVDKPRRVRICWTHGEIDADESYVQILEFKTPTTGPTGTPCFDFATTYFKAAA